MHPLDFRFGHRAIVFCRARCLPLASVAHGPTAAPCGAAAVCSLHGQVARCSCGGAGSRDNKRIAGKRAHVAERAAGQRAQKLAQDAECSRQDASCSDVCDGGRRGGGGPLLVGRSAGPDAAQARAHAFHQLPRGAPDMADHLLVGDRGSARHVRDEQGGQEDRHLRVALVAHAGGCSWQRSCCRSCGP